MGLLYKSKYTIDLNPINHMMIRLVNRVFKIKIFTNDDLYNPLDINSKFPDQMQIKFKISLYDAYSYLNSEII